MNTADQNVFVLDTAFTRRFERIYVKIDFNRLNNLEDEKKAVYTGEIATFVGSKPLMEVFNETELGTSVAELDANGKLKRNWPTFAFLVNRLIDIINEHGGSDQISEDKKLGPFFVSENDLLTREAFLNKVVYYLKQDVFRYIEQYFDLSFQTIFDKFADESSDLFNLLVLGERH